MWQGEWCIVYRIKLVLDRHCMILISSSWLPMFDRMECFLHIFSLSLSTTSWTRKLRYRKDDRAMRPIYRLRNGYYYSSHVKKFRLIDWLIDMGALKIFGLSRNKPLIKLILKCSLHLKYVLAVPWEMWSVSLSRQHNIKRTFEWFTE